MNSNLILNTAFVSASLLLRAQAQVFTENFNSGASPLWGNENGSWSAAGGVYRANVPGNSPQAFSSLPFNLTDFTMDIDINGITDGGIWLHSTPRPGTSVGVSGVLLVLKNPNGSLGTVCWQTSSDGNTMSPLLNQSSPPYAPGSNPHLHIEVSGNVYSLFLNGSVDPVTSLVTSSFPNGRVALYDNSSESFDNVVLQPVPEPASFSLLGLALGGFLLHRRRIRRLDLSGYLDAERRTGAHPC